MKELENSQSSYKNDFLQTESQADFSKVQPVGMFHLLTEKFSTAELKTLCFEFKVDYDDISGDTKRDKARELILHLKRRDRLNEFYDFLIAYLERRS
jgi:Effector-associated domain 7